VPETVLDATIDDRSAASLRFRVSTFGATTAASAAVRASLVRAALAKPAEPCEALADGNLRLAVQE
jgi:hypothetical protein